MTPEMAMVISALFFMVAIPLWCFRAYEDWKESEAMRAAMERRHKAEREALAAWKAECLRRVENDDDRA